MAKRLIIGMSGASGAPLTVELLRQLHDHHPEIETHLIVTKGGEMTLSQEMGMTLEDLKKLATVWHSNSNIGAAPASGSFRTMGMIVVPCSMKTVAGIVSGYSDNLLLRAADVVLKERRKLVLVAREAPFSTVHLRNLYEISQLGAVVLPPMLTYYNHPQSLEDCTRHTVNRILSQFDLDEGSYQWEGMDENI
jgi:polyprenyl P-hydroxybenzoate/phenylacrylic acid decarboxylase-like protein